MYDLLIGLRVYPGISKKPILKGSKVDTFGKVYFSILNSTQSLNAKIVIFSDGCGIEFHEMIENMTPERYDLEIIRVDCFSGPKSFKKQYDYLSASDAKLVALLEDDYLLDVGALDSVFKYAASQGFKNYYTFFNSSDYYTHDLHDYKSKIIYFDGDYWRTVASTTFTFLCSPATLKKNYVFFRTYSIGNFDHNIWALQTKLGWWCLLVSIFKKPSVNNFKRLLKFFLTLLLLSPLVFSRRENLWVCIPGKGTHLETLGCSFEYRPE
ncbi:MAG: hypothetical protein COA71_11320 [SAR86 cluster bacterium]|uniref:Glycosyltransferase family 2 protein n=1 Tax=SAR86 cluster bacterium TaxID=2030880 RepID=A0A2A5C9D2_9GAMM|nr:MAG: hypothetical protein COA71_11320 [SAR86 cluster bacterium]